MSGPLVVQSEKTIMLEVDHPGRRRPDIAPFAELERSPEHIHTYRMTPLSLWNARSPGHDAEQAVGALVRFSRDPVPPALLVDVARHHGPLRAPGEGHVHFYTVVSRYTTAPTPPPTGSAS